MGTVSARRLRRCAVALALGAAGLAAALPLLLGAHGHQLAVALALTGSVVALSALVFALILLPLATAVYAAEVVVAVHVAGLSVWAVPPLAALLLLLHGAAQLRERLSFSALVEWTAVVCWARRLAVTTALGLAASCIAVAAAQLPGRGGAESGIVGAVAVAVAVVLATRTAQSWAMRGGLGDRDRGVQRAPDPLRGERKRVDRDARRVEDGVAHRRGDAVGRHLADRLRAERP